MMDITDQVQEAVEYEEAPEELKLKYSEYLDEWFKANKYTDIENNPLTFKQWRIKKLEYKEKLTNLFYAVFSD